MQVRVRVSFIPAVGSVLFLLFFIQGSFLATEEEVDANGGVVREESSWATNVEGDFHFGLVAPLNGVWSTHTETSS